MLTREAWNAFLKTLEEPPPNTVFILATTEPHKVMPTIVDRCQRFDFQRPSLEQIAEVVRRVCRREGIEISDGAVAAIARPRRAASATRSARSTSSSPTAAPGRDRRRPRGPRGRRRRPDPRRRRRDRRRRRARGLRGRRAAVAIGPRRHPVRPRPARPPAPADRHPHDRRAAGLVHGHRRRARAPASPGRGDLGSHARPVGRHLSKALADIREGDEPRMTVELALLAVRARSWTRPRGFRRAARTPREGRWRAGAGRRRRTSPREPGARRGRRACPDFSGTTRRPPRPLGPDDSTGEAEPAGSGQAMRSGDRPRQARQPLAGGRRSGAGGGSGLLSQILGRREPVAVERRGGDARGRLSGLRPRSTSARPRPRTCAIGSPTR